MVMFFLTEEEILALLDPGFAVVIFVRNIGDSTFLAVYGAPKNGAVNSEAHHLECLLAGARTLYGEKNVRTITAFVQPGGKNGSL